MAILSALVLEVGINNAYIVSTINVHHAAHKSHTVLEELKHIFHIDWMAILSSLVLKVGVNNTCILTTINVPYAAYKIHTV